jgi:hypothetical protein
MAPSLCPCVGCVCAVVMIATWYLVLTWLMAGVKEPAGHVAPWSTAVWVHFAFWSGKSCEN